LTAAGLAIMIFVSAYEIGHSALLPSARPLQANIWMLAVLLVTMAIPLIFSLFEMRVALAANSPALLADAREYRVHVFTTGMAFAALLSQWLGFPLDHFAALLIVVVVAKTGWELLRDAMRVLLDASLDHETLMRIRQVIEAVPAVVGINWVTGHNAGRFRFVEAGVTLRVTEVARAAAVLRRIEEEVRAAVPHVERVLLRVESPERVLLRCAVPLADQAVTISEHFGEAPYFALATIRRDNGTVEDQRIIKNPHRLVEKAKGICVANWLVSLNIDLLLLREDVRGKGPEYVLRDAGVVMHLTDKLSLTEALSSIPHRSSLHLGQ